MRIRYLFNAFRTPVILILGLLFILTSKTLASNLILVGSGWRKLFCTALLSVDCSSASVLYLSNSVIILVYGVMVLTVIGIRHLLLPANKDLKSDFVTCLVAFGLAAAPWFLLLNIWGRCQLLLPLLLAYAVVVWAFIVVNADLYVFDKYITHRRWACRLAEWIFPVSDVVFFKFHLKRMGPGSGVLRFVPVLVYVGIIITVLGMEVNVLRDSIKVEKLGIPGDQQYVLFDPDGFWYSDKAGARSGLWRYNKGTGKERPHIRVQDLGNFYLENGFFYFYDGYEKKLLKVHAETRRTAWSLPVPRRFGPFRLAMKNGLIFVVGKGGYIALIDANGFVMAERLMSIKTWYPEVLPDGRITFVSPGRAELRITSSNLLSDEVIPLPLDRGIFKFNGRPAADYEATIITSTAYLEQPRTVYVATVWGEIFRYGLDGRRWLSSHRISPGICSIAVDSLNGLLFAYNCARGYIDVLDLESGKHLKYILVNVFANSLHLNPNRWVGVLTTRGQGMYRFDYRSIASSRSVHPAGKESGI